MKIIYQTVSEVVDMRDIKCQQCGRVVWVPDDAIRHYCSPECEMAYKIRHQLGPGGD